MSDLDTIADAKDPHMAAHLAALESQFTALAESARDLGPSRRITQTTDAVLGVLDGTIRVIDAGIAIEWARVSGLMRAARDEIERLRAALKVIDAGVDDPQETARQALESDT